ncbi:putative ribonuclease H-like domain-containing protein [Tanacetum coccineum]
MARKIQEEWEGEEERNRLAEEKATNEALIRNYDDIKARIKADRLLAEKLQEEEREQFTIEERAKFLHDTIAAQRKFLAQQRSEAIRNRPPTKNQLRNQMMTYLKHVGNFKHSELKTKKFEEIQALYEKIKRSDEDFISIGSAEDERLIKKMNEKGIDSSKKEEVKEESKEEESNRKRKLEDEDQVFGTHSRIRDIVSWKLHVLRRGTYFNDWAGLVPFICHIQNKVSFRERKYCENVGITVGSLKKTVLWRLELINLPRSNFAEINLKTLNGDEAIFEKEREKQGLYLCLWPLLPPPEDHLAKFHKMTDAKEMWDAIKSRFGGNDESKKMQKYILKQQFEGFSVSNTEGLHKGYDRFQSLLSQLEIHGAGVSTEDANQKFLRSLPSAWSQVSLIMRTKPGVDSLSFDDLYNNLRVFESDVKGSTASSSSPQNVAFISENTSSTNEVSTAYCVPNPSGQNSQIKGNQDNRRRDAWNSGTKDGSRTGKKEDSKALVTIDGEGVDWTNHSKEDEDYALMACTTKSDKKYKPSELVSERVNESNVECQPKVWSDASIIKEYESDSEDEYVSTPRKEQETPISATGGKRETAVKSSAGCNWRPQRYNWHNDYPHRALKNKGIVDSGCSRHMTGNKAYLAKFQDFNSGPVAYGGSKGYITGKGKIKPGKGPTWLFDLDYLTDSMNYHPVRSENQANIHAGQQEANHNAGTEDIIDAGDSEKEDESAQDCFVLPIWSSYSSTITPDLKTDEKREGPREEEQVFLDELERLKRQEKEANEEAEALRKDFAQETKNLSEFYKSSYDDEGAVADFTNLETIVNVSPIPTSRIISSYPSALILGDPPQQFKQEAKAIGTKWVYRNKKDERGVVVRNKARLVAQGHRKDKHDIILVQVYVDDIIFGYKESWCDEFEALMKSRFQMSSMGELTFFLRLQVKQKEDGIFMCQDKYVAEMLKKFDFANVKIASTPIETQKPLVKDEEASDVDVHLYRSMIGSLMYLTASRPDIMFAVCACSRFQVTPKSSHLSAVKRIFRYLKGTPKLGLWYPRVSSFDLESYSDSDYARVNLDRKSTIGGCQFLGRRLISWQCKKQTIVATSTTEAEYVAAASCCGQVCDSKSNIHSKTKHIAIRHHFIRDAYEKKLIQVLKIHTDDNVADLLTKAFDVSRGLIGFRESLRRVIDGTEALLLPTLFILWLDTVSTDSAKLVPLGKVLLTYRKPSQMTFLTNLSQILSYIQALISLLTTITLSTTMVVLDSCHKHNMVAYLKKSEGNAEFHEIIDFLTRSSIHHVLTISLVVSTTFVEQFWTSAKSKIINNVRHITAKVAGKPVSISEASIRSDLLWGDDVNGIDSLPNQAIFDVIQCMGHLDAKKKFVMYPRFISIFLDKQLANVPVPLDHFPVNALTSKVFSFMVKNCKYFSKKVTPLFASMLVQPTEDEGAPSERL